VLGYQFLFGDSIEKRCTLHPVNILIRKGSTRFRILRTAFSKASSVDCIYQPLAEATPGFGFFQYKPDQDGIIRRVPLLMEYDGQFYAHLSLATLLSAVKPEHMVLTVGRAGAENLSIDDVEIPLQNKDSS